MCQCWSCKAGDDKIVNKDTVKDGLIELHYQKKDLKNGRNVIMKSLMNLNGKMYLSMQRILFNSQLKAIGYIV